MTLHITKIANIKLDEPNINGRIYSYNLVKAIQKKIDEGKTFITKETNLVSLVPLETKNIVGIINGIFVDNAEIYLIWKELIPLKEGLREVCLHCIGLINDDKTISDIEFLQASIYSLTSEY